MNTTMNKKLTKCERMACRILSHLKYNKQDEFYKCPFNDMLMNMACFLLHGRDPVEFIIWLLDVDQDEKVVLEPLK